MSAAPHTAALTTPTSIRLLRLCAVLDRTGLSRSGVYELMEAGRFPSRVRLSARSIAWVESEIDLWCAERIATRDSEAAA